MVQYSPGLDKTFAALADPTRLGILEQLKQGEASISDLSKTAGITLTGIRKHVQILEATGLVNTVKVGRVRKCRLGPKRLDEEAAWINAYQTMLDGRYDRLEAFLERTRGEP